MTARKLMQEINAVGGRVELVPGDRVRVTNTPRLLASQVRTPVSPHDTELLTIAEAADLLRLRPSTLRSWILKRRIPFVKLGSRVFIRRSDCEALIAASVVPAQGDRHARV